MDPGFRRGDEKVRERTAADAAASCFDRLSMRLLFGVAHRMDLILSLSKDEAAAPAAGNASALTAAAFAWCRG